MAKHFSVDSSNPQKHWVEDLFPPEFSYVDGEFRRRDKTDPILQLDTTQGDPQRFVSTLQDLPTGGMPKGLHRPAWLDYDPDSDAASQEKDKADGATSLEQIEEAVRKTREGPSVFEQVAKG